MWGDVASATGKELAERIETTLAVERGDIEFEPGITVEDRFPGRLVPEAAIGGHVDPKPLVGVREDELKRIGVASVT